MVLRRSSAKPEASKVVQENFGEASPKASDDKVSEVGGTKSDTDKVDTTDSDAINATTNATDNVSSKPVKADKTGIF